MRKYEMSPELNSDPNWRALLYIMTSVPGLQSLQVFIDLERGEVDVEGWNDAIVVMSSSDRVLAKTALHLFNPRNEGPEIADVVATLDEDNWYIFLKALALSRS